MLYTLLCYNKEDVVWSWSKDEDAAVMANLSVVHEKLVREGKLGTSLRLLPTTAAATLRPEGLVIDGPFAETKEQLLGFYVIDVENLEAALDVARQLSAANPTSVYEVRPVALVCARCAARRADPGHQRLIDVMTDMAWINSALIAARPQAVGALLRYFRDMDMAEEAYQDACLRALKTLARKGAAARSHRLADPGGAQRRTGRRTQAAAAPRRCRRKRRCPIWMMLESALAERLDGSHYRDDVLRLLFICCHPDLPATQQIALALRIVSGLSGERRSRTCLPSGWRGGDGAAHHPRQGPCRQSRGAVRGARTRRTQPSVWQPWRR